MSLQSEPQVLEQAKQLWVLELPGPGRPSQDSEPEPRLWVQERGPQASMLSRHDNQLRKLSQLYP